MRYSGRHIGHLRRYRLNPLPTYWLPGDRG